MRFFVKFLDICIENHFSWPIVPEAMHVMYQYSACYSHLFKV